MATASVVYTFIPNDTERSADMNANFAALTSFINTNAIQKDGSTAMTAPLNLSGDPTLANHAVRKAYLDARVPVTSGTYSPLLSHQGFIPTLTINYAHWMQVGAMVSCSWFITITQNTGQPAGSAIYISLPMAAQVLGGAMGVGGIRWSDGTANTRIGMGVTDSGGGGGNSRIYCDFSTLIQSPVLLNGHSISGTCTYPVA